MKMKPHVLRNGNQSWSDLADSLRADSWNVPGHRGDVLAKSVTAAGPQTAQAPQDGPVEISLAASGTAYTQNFDTLASTGTSSTMPTEWFFSEAGGNTLYTAGTGSSNTGDTYSYGIAGTNVVTERALGSVASNALQSSYGTSFTNNTGGTITSLAISYFGEQWRAGNNVNDDRLDFQISFNATSLITGTWSNIDALDFSSIISGVTATLDGNAAANRLSISSNVTSVDSVSLAIANGATFWIRWVDVNISGNDDGLAIDDFSLTPNPPGSLSINDVTLAEGDTGTTLFTFTVTRTGGSSGAVGATWTLNAPGGGDADAGDFAGAQLFTGTVSFADGDTSETITILVQGDDLIESDEDFTVTLSLPTGGATITDTSGAGLITNDDAAGAFSIDNVTVTEGNSGTTQMTFTVTRATGDDGAVAVDYSVNAPGGAGFADSSDFAGGTTFLGTLNFGDGETSKTIVLDVVGDAVFEGNETFDITLSDATNGATIADASGLGTINNDDAPPVPVVSVADASIVELDASNNEMVFIVSLTSAPTSGSITVDFTTVNGTALALEDYTMTSGQIVFLVGEMSKEIRVPVFGDTTFEPDETFTVTLSNPSGATIGDGEATGTIVNNDPNPNPGSVSIADAAIVEGDAGTTILQLTVTRSGGTAAFSVDFATSDGGNPNNAAATAGSDYAAQTGTLNFAIGQNTATIDIVVNVDDIDELSEELTVTLSNATNGASLADGTAIGTITTDDSGPAGPPGVWLNEFHYDNAGTDAGEFVEIAGVAGTSLAGYSIVLYNGNGGASYQTINLSGTIPNLAGGYGAVAVVPTSLQNGSPDGIALVGPGGVIEFISYEGAFTAVGGAANGMTSVDVGVEEPGDATGTSIGRLGGPNSPWVLIGNDSPGALNGGQELGPTPHVSVSDVTVDESAGTMTFTITRTNVDPGAFTVDYATANGSATAGTDYTATSGTLNFAANQVQATVTVAISDDGAAEFDETLFLNLGSITGGAVLDDNQALGTITNDDGPPILVSVNDVIQAEGTSGTTTFTFTVTRSGGTDAFSIDFATADGTATVAGSDYVATSGTLNFGVGQTTQTISVTVNGDASPESIENFFVNLSNPTNEDVIVTDASGAGTILDGVGTMQFIHDIQGTAYFSPILAAEGITNFNQASAMFVTVQAIVTAVDNVGNRQGFYIQEQVSDWDGNSFTSEGIFVMTRNDAGVGTAVSGVAAGDLVTVSARVMEYQGFSSNMPITALVSPSAIVVNSTGNSLPAMVLTNMPNEVMTLVTPDYTDSADGAGDSFDASVYALSYFETVEGMLVTIPNMVVADGFVSTSGGDPFLQAYSLDSANADQINSRGGYTIAGDPPVGPPDTAATGDDTHNDGRVLHDGDVNPDIIELDFTGWAISAPPGLTQNATMGDLLGDVTGIIDFDFTDRKLFVTAMEPGGFVDGGSPVQEVTVLGDDTRSLTVATFNVENLDPGDGAARFTALANVIATNLNAPDIISIEEMQDNNGATSSGGADASITWQMLVDALNLATGAHYQWVDQEPVAGAEGGEPGGNIRVGFLYNTDRVQLGDLAANATIAERRMYTDRIGDGVRDAGDLIAFSDNMLGAEINTADWAGTRRSLLGEFTFHGNKVYVTANHWPAKGGSGDFWQFDQNLGAGQPDNSDWAQRNQVGQDVYSMMNLIQSTDADAGIAAGGDFNDFYFYRPLTTLTGHTLADGTARVGGARFENLTLTLAEAERYTYTFDGRSQAIDHIVVNSLLGGVATYDVVHINTGYNAGGTDPSLSDHDPALSSFDYREFSETLVGTSGNDMIDGFGGDDTISGLAGDDILAGNVGTDQLAGGGDNDTYLIADANDTVIELSGEGNRDIIYTTINYTLAANVYVEVLAAGSAAGTDPLQLIGNSLANEIYGNAGDNLIHGGGGADLLVGLLGNDIYYTDVAGTVVIERAGEGTDALYTSVSYTLGGNAEVETLSTNDYGSAAAIGLTGNFYAQTLIGNAGANILHGGGGADILIGLGGNDVYYTDVAAATVFEGGGGGNDIVYASVSYALAAGQEVEILSTNLHAGTAAINLTGNGLDQTIFGNAGANVLHGGGGTDMLYGLNGNDTYYVDVATTRIFENPGDGSDTVYASLSFALGADQEIETLSTNSYASTAAINLTGNVFANTILGNAGANVLDGQRGNDTLIGLDGADTYAFTTGLGADNVDSVLGFVHNVDKVAVDNAVFVGIGGEGALGANAFHTGSAAHDADDRIIYDSATGQLFFDADGSGAGAAVQFATLSPGLGLTASDFLVI